MSSEVDDSFLMAVIRTACAVIVTIGSLVYWVKRLRNDKDRGRNT